MSATDRITRVVCSYHPCTVGGGRGGRTHKGKRRQRQLPTRTRLPVQEDSQGGSFFLPLLGCPRLSLVHSFTLPSVGLECVKNAYDKRHLHTTEGSGIGLHNTTARMARQGCGPSQHHGRGARSARSAQAASRKPQATRTNNMFQNRRQAQLEEEKPEKQRMHSQRKLCL